MNNNKKCLVLLTAFVSTNLYANTIFYFGADVLISNQLEMPSFYGNNPETTYDADTGFSLQLGALFFLTDRFQVALEGEYNAYGDINHWLDTDIQLLLEGSAFFANIKPKIFLIDDRFFLAGLFGFGQFDTTMTLSIANSRLYGSGSNYGYQYGIEAGYQFSDSVVMGIGYKIATLDDKGYDDTFYSGLYSGIRYYF